MTWKVLGAWLAVLALWGCRAPVDVDGLEFVLLTSKNCPSCKPVDAVFKTRSPVHDGVHYTICPDAYSVKGCLGIFGVKVDAFPTVVLKRHGRIIDVRTGLRFSMSDLKSKTKEELVAEQFDEMIHVSDKFALESPSRHPPRPGDIRIGWYSDQNFKRVVNKHVYGKTIRNSDFSAVGHGVSFDHVVFSRCNLEGLNAEFSANVLFVSTICPDGRPSTKDYRCPGGGSAL